MRILIIGATGLLGRALLDHWHEDEVVPASSRDANICSPAELRALFARCSPDWVVLAAAYSDVDGCEKNPGHAHEVNTQGAVNVAQAARDFHARLLLLSSDYVFDGSKQSPYEPADPPHPLNVYGRSKAEAEQRTRELLPGCCILRTSWIFGTAGPCFPETILNAARNQEELHVVNDQRGAPTWNRDLARAIIRLVHSGAQGIVHATNAGECTWFEFAQEILRGAGLGRVKVLPVSSQELGRPAARPNYSVLSLGSLEPYGVSMRPWPEALRSYLAERRAQPSPAGSKASPGRQAASQSS